jgi:hypothetical protein
MFAKTEANTMNTLHPGVTGRGLDDEPLVVRPNTAMRLLDCSRATLYEFINNGELESYLDGAARKITMRSIRARIKRKLREFQKQKVA